MIEQYTSKPPGFLCTSRRDACGIVNFIPNYVSMYLCGHIMTIIKNADFCGNFMYLGFGYNGPQMNYVRAIQIIS